MRASLETGYRLAQAQDDRVALARLISRPGTTPAVKAAAIAVLRVSDPEEMRWFLEVGQYRVTG
ncbi:ALF repeat-containing protein [Streptomyces sp. NPDC019990]|uniref:ALF repeat-containing protein n=1 Tax=Streptomyces sp. NPDC019990 TaxID=3154693 RepID=UPI0033D2A746